MARRAARPRAMSSSAWDRSAAVSWRGGAAVWVAMAGLASFRFRRVEGTRRGPVVLDRDADAHGFFALVLLGDFGGQAGGAAHDEDELAGERRKAEVVEDGGKGAVNVEGQGLDLSGGGGLECEHELDAGAGELLGARQIEE